MNSHTGDAQHTWSCTADLQAGTLQLHEAHVCLYRWWHINNFSCEACSILSLILDLMAAIMQPTVALYTFV